MLAEPRTGVSSLTRFRGPGPSDRQRRRPDGALTNRPVISVVTTLYRSTDYVREFYDRISRSIVELEQDFEIVFVDDGCPEGSLAVAVELQREDPRVTVLELSRNFGHHRAIMAGLSAARGDFVFLLDVDLEEPPELVAQFWQVLADDSETDVVFGVQRQRERGWLQDRLGSLFYFLLRLLSGLEIPANLTMARLMRRRYVDALLLCGEAEPVMAGLWSYVGFRQRAVEIDKSYKGSTDYGPLRKLRQVFHSVTGFSDKPLRLIFAIGAAVSIIAGASSIYLVLRKLIFGLDIAGWISLMVSIWFLGGLLLLSVGTVGLYLGKVFVEVKHRPLTVVRRIHRQESRDAAEVATPRPAVPSRIDSR